MQSTQVKSNLTPVDGPLITVPKISIFDKREQANLSRFTRLPNNQQSKRTVNLPQVRINQHKGA